QVGDLLLEVPGRPAAFASTGGGHDAKGARAVAALVHGNALGYPRRADGSGRLLAVELLQIDQVDQFVFDGQVLARRQEEVDERVLLLPPVDVADAAGQGNFQLRPLLLEQPKLAELAVDLGLGVLAHHAGVQDDEVGGCLRIARLVAVGFQLLGQHPSIGAIHLAANGPDMERAQWIVLGVRVSRLERVYSREKVLVVLREAGQSRPRHPRNRTKILPPMAVVWYTLGP